MVRGRSQVACNQFSLFGRQSYQPTKLRKSRIGVKAFPTLIFAKNKTAAAAYLNLYLENVTVEQETAKSIKPLHHEIVCL